MDFVTVLLIAVGLAMDAFAVSIASGIGMKFLKVSNALTIAIFFGLFQAVMPLIGWLAGLRARDFISGVDHWVVFGLLGAIGCKMLYEAVKMGKAEKEVNLLNPLNIYVLFLLSIATSIDALAVGLSFAFLKISIITPVLVIGTVTLTLAFLGVFLGDKFGHLFESKIEILGAFILIGIGTKILLEHLGYFG